MNGARILALAGTDPPEVSASKLESFRRFLLLAVAVEQWELLAFWAGKSLQGVHLALAMALAACAVTGWFSRWRRAATAAAAVLMLVDHALAFPLNANHQYLGLLCCGLLALADAGRADERQLVLRAVRWLAVIGLVWAGLQKVLYGYYFRGEFLAYAISRSESFAAVFRPLMPADDWVRLREIRLGDGAGPYRVDSLAFVAVSNASYLLELILPPLLLFARTRGPAIVATMLYILAIEAGARELFFGALMINMLLLFTRTDVNRKLLPFFVALFAYALAMAFGLLPRWHFS